MGCLSARSYSVAPSDQRLSGELAELSREQYEDYISRFRPLELEAIAENLNDSVIQEGVSEARSGANSAWDAARGVSDRALSDYGATLDPDQKRTRDRLYKQNRSASVADTTNTVRAMETDRRYQRGDDLMRTGRAVEGTAAGQYSAAAQMEAARGRANAQAQTAASAAQANNNASLLGMGLGMLAFFSDEELKHKISSVSDEQALKDVRAIDVKSYEYKPETGLDQKPKVGGMKDDMPDYVKREDGMVDVQNSIGMLTAAVRALDKKVEARA